LQSVNNLDSSLLFDPAIESIVKDSVISAKDKEIEDLRKELADCRSTISKVRAYYSDTKKLHRHIEIELGIKQDDSIIDLSNSPTLPPPAVPTATTSTVRNSSRSSTSIRITSTSAATLHRPTATISSRVRRKYQLMSLLYNHSITVLIIRTCFSWSRCIFSFLELKSSCHLNSLASRLVSQRFFISGDLNDKFVKLLLCELL
jgi:hypothetical protein